LTPNAEKQSSARKKQITHFIKKGMDPRLIFQTWRFEMADSDITRIAGNIGALNALNSLSTINKQLAIHQTRLASGKRINTAADDPAGLTIATKMQARSEGLSTALSNIGDAKNLLAVAESGLGRINDILIQMRNKAESGASDTMGTSERQALVDQMTAYSKQIDDIVAQTKWTSSSPSLIGGEYKSKSLTFQTGVDQGENTTLSGLNNMSASASDGLDIAAVGTTTGAATAISSTVVGSFSTSAVVTSTGLTALESGTYRVEVNYGADSAAAVTVKLYSGSDTTNPIRVDADGDGASTTTATDTQVTLANSSGAHNVNFGNGLSISINAWASDQTASDTVNFAKTGADYNLKLSTGGSLTSASTAANFAQYMNDINSKLDTVSSQLAQIGSMTGRLSFKEDQISNAQINVESAYNRIMNADMASEQVESSKYVILQQTATAMLAQANSSPQFLLSLFR
jgi:flagellin